MVAKFRANARFFLVQRMHLPDRDNRQLNILHRGQCLWRAWSIHVRVATAARTIVISLGSRKHLDRAVPAAADDPTAIRTPDDTADAFTSHNAVALDLLRAAPLFEVPEAETGVVATRHQLSTVW